MSAFGDNLKDLRKSRGYTQDRFARVIGTNQVNVSAWELGTRRPNLETIKHIAEIFRVPVSTLISLSETGNSDDYVQEIADMLHEHPKVRMMFDRAKYLSESDLDAVLNIIDAITRERGDDD